MEKIVSVECMRLSDKKTIEGKTPSLELMYRAGEEIFKRVDWHGRILIACGSGNNAGDGYVLAGLLKKSGYDVSILLIEERFSQDGLYYFEMCKSQNVPTRVYNGEKISGYEIIVDCIFGTGFHGMPTGLYKTAIEMINESGAYVVSADINSGLNGDSGMAKLCVKSNKTISIGTYKSGHFLNMAKDNIVSLENADIGIDIIGKSYCLLEKKDVSGYFKKRNSFSNKGTYGYITLIGGCTEYSGAIKLASLASASLRSGCGVVKIATPKSICSSVMPYILEATLYPLSENDGSIKFVEKEIQGALNNVKSACIGMGLGQRGENERMLEYILRNYQIPLIIDADGLNTLSKMDISLVKDSGCRVILTPHLKEFERLCGIPMEEILTNPIKYAREYASKADVILLLKGTATIITDGDEVIITNTGCAGMATAGSGDVLSGILCALCACAKKSELLMAVSVGAYINGYAGEIAKEEYGDISMIASDTARSIGLALKRLTQ